MKHFISFSAMIAICLIVSAQGRYELNTGWKMMQASQVQEAAQTISARPYSTSTWKKAVVPGTVLTSQLALHEVPDPFYGMNNKNIPDIYHTGRDYYTYWFVNDFNEPGPQKGRQVWLELRGVNYSCDVYVNGRKLNDTTHKGMFLRQRYNISANLSKSGQNRLAVIVYPPDPVGNPNGGQGGDGTIAKNVSHQYVAGWDWIQPVRDRNTGIWDKVFIERTGEVIIKDPHIVTLVPGKRNTTGFQKEAMVQLSATLDNNSAMPVGGVLEYTLEGKRISKHVTVPAKGTKAVRLPDYRMINPKKK